MPGTTGDECAEAVASALAPYAWRRLTDRMLARMVVGAVDRHTVLRFLAGVPGVCVVDTSPVDPADADDERAHALVRALDGRHCRTWSLGRLTGHLLGALKAWHAEREALDVEPRRLPEGL